MADWFTSESGGGRISRGDTGDSVSIGSSCVIRSVESGSVSLSSELEEMGIGGAW